MWKGMSFVLLATAFALAAPPRVRGAEEPLPGLEVILQRGFVYTHDEIPVEVWLNNPRSGALEDVQMWLGVPEFVTVRQGSCRGRAAASPLVIGNMAPWSVRRVTLCLRTLRSVVEGDFSLTFVLQYRWQTPEGGRATGHALQEKKLSASLFGTGTIAGVPLSLLAYLVPGVILLVVLRVLGMPKLDKLSSTELAALLVLFSLLMIWLSSGQLGQAVSVPGFAGLCAASLVAALVLALPLIYLKFRERERTKNLIDITDLPTAALEKAFAASRNCPRGPVRIVLKNGKVLYGSMAADARDGVALFGWSQLDPNGWRYEIESLMQDAKYSRIAAMARERGLTIEWVNAIQEVKPGDGGLATTGKSLMILSKADIVEGPAVSTHQDLTPEPLTLREERRA